MKVFNAKKMFDMLPKDENHALKGWKPILGEGDTNSDIMMIGKAATAFDATSGRPYSGKPGLTVRRTLLQQNVKWYGTYAVPFFGGKGVDAKKVHADLAAPILQKEFETINPKRVVLFGKDAVTWLPQFDFPFKKFDELLGRNIDVDGISYRVLQPPTMFARDPGGHKLFVRGINELMGRVKKRSVSSVREDYKVITDKAEALAYMESLPEVFGLDLETTGLDVYTVAILTVSLSTRVGEGITIPWTLLSKGDWYRFLNDRAIIGQNGQYDIKVLANHGVYMNLSQDSMLQHSIVNETPRTHHMELMAHTYLNVEKWGDTVDYSTFKHGLIGMSPPEGLDLSEPPTQTLETVGMYAARDVDITMRLHKRFDAEVGSRPITSMLPRVQNALIKSELRGIKIDRDLAFQMQEEILDIKEQSRDQLDSMYGLKNPNSVQQVKRLLYTEMGVPVQKLKGKVTTQSELLEPLADEFPVIADILEYRRLGKAEGTYLKNILKSSERDGRYHSDIRLAATRTGRVTERILTLLPRSEDIENPDLGQQYQTRLRELFIPDDGHLMIGADYSALEVRVAAYLTKDPTLVKDIADNIDIHSVNAINAFGLDIPLKPYDTLKARTSESNARQRTLAKIATFASLYGGTSASIALQAGIELDLAQSIIDQLYSRYPRLKIWQDEIVQIAENKGFVETPWGRRRHFQFYRGMSETAHADQRREAINTLVQSHGNDINLMAYAKASEYGIQTLFPFHDAIYAQAPIESAERVAGLIKQVMETIVTGPVFFESDVHIGKNWSEL